MDQYYTLEEVADNLGVSEQILTDAVKKGDLRAVIIGGSEIRVSKTDLDDFLDRSGRKVFQPVSSENTVIVTQHEGAVEWLNRHGIFAPVYRRARVADVRGKDVYGILPIPIAAEARNIYIPRMAHLPEDKPRRELAANDMEKLGCRLISYYVVQGERK
jgi:putative CRISPR-associated protein (TIGR02620 family)